MSLSSWRGIRDRVRGALYNRCLVVIENPELQVGAVDEGLCSLLVTVVPISFNEHPLNDGRICIRQRPLVTAEELADCLGNAAAAIVGG